MKTVIDELGDVDRAHVMERAAKIRELASDGPGAVAIALVWTEHQAAIETDAPDTSRDWGKGWSDSRQVPPALRVFRALRDPGPSA